MITAILTVNQLNVIRLYLRPVSLQLYKKDTYVIKIGLWLSTTISWCISDYDLAWPGRNDYSPQIVISDS